MKREGITLDDAPAEIRELALRVHQAALAIYWETKGRKRREQRRSDRHSVTDDGQIQRGELLMPKKETEEVKKKKETKPELLGSKEVAEKLGVTPATFRRYLRAKGKGAKATGDGRYGWEPDSVDLTKVMKAFKAYQAEQAEAAEERKNEKKKAAGKKKAKKDEDEDEEETEELE